jgi:hypothetical protein
MHEFKHGELKSGLQPWICSWFRPSRRALLQDVELMPQYHDFGFQPRPWLEEVAKHADEQEADRNHSAIMF